MVDTAHRRVLGAAALVAGLGGLALIAVGWWLLDWRYSDQWSRFGDGAWWASMSARALGYLALGKLGFKVALATVIAILALVTMRGRLSRGAAERPQPPGPAEGPQS